MTVSATEVQAQASEEDVIADRTRIKAKATGTAINSAMSIEDQIGAIREQVADILIAEKITPNAKFKKLQDVVSGSKSSRK